jgi:fructose-1,6-bisphosphatase/sedoheptulose 1,7-bisphosphatase-like protein
VGTTAGGPPPATRAMRRALADAPGLGTVVIGEGEKDGAPMLYNGERVGDGGPAFDIAVDPLECTTFCANGLPGSLTTIAIAEGGALLRLGPSHYMEKLVVPPAARHAVDIADIPEVTLARTAAGSPWKETSLAAALPRAVRMARWIRTAGGRNHGRQPRSRPTKSTISASSGPLRFADGKRFESVESLAPWLCLGMRQLLSVFQSTASPKNAI